LKNEFFRIETGINDLCDIPAFVDVKILIVASYNKFLYRSSFHYYFLDIVATKYKIIKALIKFILNFSLLLTDS